MSTFTKALEQAERERGRQQDVARHDGDIPSTPGTPVPPTVPARPARPVAGLEAIRPPANEAEPANGIEDHLVSILHPASFVAEPYRVLRHRVEQARRATQVSVVAVSSAGVGEGKTTTSINLAGALAQGSDARVLLIDADLRKSSVARHLALADHGGRGLVDVIQDPTLSLHDVVIQRPAFNLDVLPAGTAPTAPYEVLKSPRLGELLDEARSRYDYVILDTAPLVPVPDSRLIGKWVDAFLLVVAAHRTPRKVLAEALNLLEPAKLIGIVFNEDDEALSSYHGYATYGASRDDSRSSWWSSLRRRLLTSSTRTRARGQRTVSTKGTRP